MRFNKTLTYVQVSKKLLKSMEPSDRALFLSVLAGVSMSTMAEACGMTTQGMRDWITRVVEQVRCFADPLE